MTKDVARRGNQQLDNDEFLVQHLVDPNNWVADHERTVCNVCTRSFGTFRRKHHCRMCGEVVCSGCTLHKNALLSTIGHTRVRVCISCIFNGGDAATPAHNAGGRKSPHAKSHSPRSASPTTEASDESSRRWLSNHLHSPLSQADHDFDPADSPSAMDRYADNQRSHNRSHHRVRSNQDTNDDGAVHSPLHPHYANWTHPWPKPPVPYDEIDRLEALAALQILDTEPEKAFDMICDLAKARLACPMTAVSFMDEHRQWFKASVGLAHKMIPRKIAFCAYPIFSKELVVVLDTLKDKRFECNPLVSGAAAVRFYAAAPIIDPNTGYAVGSVFVLDTRPRESFDGEILERLAQATAENLPLLSDDLDGQPTIRTSMLATRPPHQIAAVGPMPPPADVVAAPAKPSAALTTSSATTNANGESMEMLLMRLLTQNTETQQQLASQQMTLNSTLNQHSVQISQLMHNVARMEAKIETTVRSRGA